MVGVFGQHVPFRGFRLQGELRAPPRTRNYWAVGQAFDYLLRFHLGRLHPQAKEKAWVAESLLQEGMLSRKDQRLAATVVARARAAARDYLAHGQVTDQLLTAAMQVARLDAMYRAAVWDPGIGQEDDAEDLQDLRALLAVAEGEPLFQTKHKVVALNPVFGVSGWKVQGVRLPEGYTSTLIGGADVDLLLGDTLLEIKTTKEPKVERRTYYQLVAYYALAKLGGIGGFRQQPEVRWLAVYFSRYGCVAKWPTPDLSDAFWGWFLRAAVDHGPLKGDPPAEHLAATWRGSEGTTTLSLPARDGKGEERSNRRSPAPQKASRVGHGRER